jgi:hypothetical protein
VDFAALRSELDDLAGLDLTTTERDRLLNEGYRKLVCEADWLRAAVEVGPTAVGTDDYALPSTVYRILRLSVNGLPFYPTDEETIQDYTAGDAYYRLPSGSGWYYLTYDSAGAERVSLYPSPTTAGHSIIARAVLRPNLLTADADEPLVPYEYCRYIIEYAKSIAYGSVEDSQDLQAFYRGEFDRGVAELRALRNSKRGRAPVSAKVVGIHV